ncbi:hypothetical protein WJX72_000265 [[Myrmecia] bisecta]|uniref:Uncharacterized protein n=1 Tax=[Myrmecia] bisecta TaxID=41462 RepID=A0AAW1QPR1_9CHLO
MTQHAEANVDDAGSMQSRPDADAQALPSASINAKDAKTSRSFAAMVHPVRGVDLKDALDSHGNFKAMIIAEVGCAYIPLVYAAAYYRLSHLEALSSN